MRGRVDYTTHYTPTASAIADEVAGAGRNLAADQVACFAEDMPLSESWPMNAGPGTDVKYLVGAAESLSYKPIAVLQQIEANLVTGQRERVEGIEVYVTGQKGSDTVLCQHVDHDLMENVEHWAYG